MRVYLPTPRSKTYWIEFRDHQAIPRRVAALRDRKLSLALGRRIVELVNVHVAGERPDAALSKWLEGLPAKLRSKLARFGVIDPRRVAALRTLSEHLDDWAQYLAAKDNTEKHVALVTGRARRAVEGCGFAYWSEVSASRVMAYLSDLRGDKVDDKGDVKRGVSKQTSNFYLSAVKGFCRWMVRDGRASENPLVHLDPLNARTDRRHDRRALSVEEVRWLIDTTSGKNSPERYGMSGPERAMLYRLAVETGLRASELRSLTRASFNLTIDNPTVRVAAAYSKRRREDVLPLRPDTTAELRDHLATKHPGARAFVMPKSERTAKMFRADLDAARQAWLRATTLPQGAHERTDTGFLTPVDDAGRHADFHALRHTAGSLLAASGTHPKVAQSLMRHSTIDLTMSRYTHTLAGQESAAIENLPDLSAKPAEAVAEANGTDGGPARKSLARSLAQRGSLNQFSPDFAGRKADKSHAAETLMNSGQTADSGASEQRRRGGRVVEGGGLENRCTLTGTGGSNPLPSAILAANCRRGGRVAVIAPWKTRKGASGTKHCGPSCNASAGGVYRLGNSFETPKSICCSV